MKYFISSFWLSSAKAEEKENGNKILCVSAEAEVG